MRRRTVGDETVAAMNVISVACAENTEKLAQALTPLCAESCAWRAGKIGGLFPGMTLCNSHGTLDRRGRLWKYVDDEVSS